MPKQDEIKTTESELEQDAAKLAESKEDQVLDAKTELEENKLELTQSQLDQLIGSKVFKALQKKDIETQAAIAKEKGDYESLYDTTMNELNELKQEKSQAETKQEIMRLAATMGLSEYSDSFIQLNDLETAVQMMDTFKKALDVGVSEKVNAQLTTPSITAGKNPEIPTNLSDCTDIQQYRKLKESRGIK